jgi:hypothetical protein
MRREELGRRLAQKLYDVMTRTDADVSNANVNIAVARNIASEGSTQVAAGTQHKPRQSTRRG